MSNRNFGNPRDFISFEKIDRQPLGRPSSTGGLSIALDGGIERDSQIRLASAMPGVMGLRSLGTRSKKDQAPTSRPVTLTPSWPNLGAALGRSPFLPIDSQPTFPLVKLLRNIAHVFAVAFGLGFLLLLAAAIPLCIAVFMLVVA